MSRSDERQAALRFCLLALGWLACLFGWACVLSFSVADAPSTTVWPNPPQAHNLCGPVGAWLAYYAFRYLGLAVYPLLLLVHVGVIAWSRGARLNDLWLRFIGLTLICGASAGGAALLFENTGQFLITGPGGIVGTAAVHFFLPKIQAFGTALLLIVAALVGFVLAADNLVVAAIRLLRWAGDRSGPALARSGQAVATAGAAVAGSVASIPSRLRSAPSDEEEEEEEVEEEERPTPKRRAVAEPVADDEDDEELDEDEELEEDLEENQADEDEEEEEEEEEEDDEEDEEDDEEEEEEEEIESPIAAQPGISKPPVVKSMTLPEPLRPKLPQQPPPPRPIVDDGDYELPAIDQLEAAVAVDKSAIEQLCREKAYVLEQTLNEFRLEVEVVSIETGPVITVFELKLAPGIKVSQIASLTNDMARALKAPAVRVVAPLPGKNTIGIEVPNIDKEKVRLRDVMETAASKLNQQAIPLFLGKDASGQPLVTDLTRMPHLLIAGTTGSGKSVCVNSIIMSVLLTRTPKEVQMILVDPKVVELAAYKDIPHLMCPIVTDVSRAEGILDWASVKMDERYALLAEAGVKDIRSYNRLGREGLKERLQATDEEMDKITVYLPYIVIIIDELADLMMTSAKEVEFYLCRIAQKSRAVGIHLIVSTQRPQANVVTGLIKSNLPSRIAFRVSSRLDSRIVLDQNGAEVLMGQGDMLFLPPGSSKLLRAQGTFIDDDELKQIVKHVREQREPQFHPELVRLPGADAGGATERDELFDQSVDIIVETGRGSVSLLQRRLNVGYSRASRLIDQMYAAGIVGEYKGSQAREVVVTKDEWEAIKAQRNREEAEEIADLPME